MIDPTDRMDDRKIQARQSFTGQSLTQSQFDEAWALSGIIAREIHKTGSFRDKLSDYAHAFARSERFDAVRGEEIVRDIFRVRYDETMNQMRERLTIHEREIDETVLADALEHARWIPDLIRMAPTLPFYRAYDQTAVSMAETHNITETAAKEMMKTAFASREGRELYEAGKEAEGLYYKPRQRVHEEKQQQTESRLRRRKNLSQT